MGQTEFLALKHIGYHYKLVDLQCGTLRIIFFIVTVPYHTVNITIHTNFNFQVVHANSTGISCIILGFVPPPRTLAVGEFHIYSIVVYNLSDTATFQACLSLLTVVKMDAEGERRCWAPSRKKIGKWACTYLLLTPRVGGFYVTPSGV